MGHLNSNTQADFHLLPDTGKCSLWYHHNVVLCINVVSTSISFIFYCYVYLFLCVYMSHSFRCLKNWGEDISSAGVGITCSCELPHLSSEKWAWSPGKAKGVLIYWGICTSPYICFAFSSYFTCMGVLPPCVSVHSLYKVPEESRRMCQISWDWRYRQLWATM